jgi:hypothetical protein
MILSKMKKKLKKLKFPGKNNISYSGFKIKPAE